MKNAMLLLMVIVVAMSLVCAVAIWLTGSTNDAKSISLFANMSDGALAFACTAFFVAMILLLLEIIDRVRGTLSQGATSSSARSDPHQPD